MNKIKVAHYRISVSKRSSRRQAEEVEKVCSVTCRLETCDLSTTQRDCKFGRLSGTAPRSTRKNRIRGFQVRNRSSFVGMLEKIILDARGGLVVIVLLMQGRCQKQIQLSTCPM